MDKHIIWKSDIGDLDLWKDAIEEEMMENDEFFAARNDVAENEWYMKVEADKERYDNMLVKDYNAEKISFIEQYIDEHPVDVEQYIRDNEEKCYNYVLKLNEMYLDDEKVNLSEIKDRRIIVFGKLGLWNGPRLVASAPDELRSVSDCLKRSNMRNGDSEIEYYIDDGDLKCTEHHHDGTNSYTYRFFSDNIDDDDIDELIYKAKESSDFSVIYKATKSLAPEICAVYGWTYEPNDYDKDVFSDILGIEEDKVFFNDDNGKK